MAQPDFDKSLIVVDRQVAASGGAATAERYETSRAQLRAGEDIR